MNDFEITGSSFWNKIASSVVTPEEAVAFLVNLDGYRGPWLAEKYSRPSDISNLISLTRYFSLFTEPGYRSFIIGLETVLADGLQQTDLCFGLHRRNFALAGGQAAAKFAPQLQASDRLLKVFNLLQRWLTEEPFVSRLFEHFWMEFDIDEGEENPAPNIFFGIHPSGDYVPMVASCLESLGLPADQDGWRKVVANVEGRAAMLQIGAMVARPSAPLRVVALDLGPGAENYVMEAGGNSFTGDNARHWKDLEPFHDGLSGIDLDVDWHSGETGPRVGVEYDFAYCKDRPEQRRQRLETFLRHAAEQGWCYWPKAEALLTFPGRYACRRNGLATGTILQTDLSHIKVDFSPGGPPRIKAYGELIMAETASQDIEKGVE